MSSHLSRTACRVSAGSGSVCVPPSRSGAGDVRRKYRQEVSPRLTKLYRDRGLPTGTLGSVASGCGARDGAVPQVVCGWLVWGEEGGGPGRAALGCLMTVGLSADGTLTYGGVWSWFLRQKQNVSLHASNI